MLRERDRSFFFLILGEYWGERVSEMECVCVKL